MENCFGVLSANPCSACKNLSRQKRESRRATRHGIRWTNADYGAVDGTHRIDRGLVQPIVDDATDDAQLANLAQHLFMSDPLDYEKRQAGKDPFDDRWCKTCFLSFRSKKARLQHVKECNLHIVCRWCNDPTEYASKHDLRQHNCGDRVCCWLCKSPTFWPSRAALEQHKWEVHLTCEACEVDVMFLSKEYLKKHKRTAHGAVYCHFCNMLFADKAVKDIHMGGSHSKCFYCQLYFDDEQSRVRHRAVYCHFCKQDFLSSDKKEAHMKSVHAKECEDCKFNEMQKMYCFKHWTEREERKVGAKWFRGAWWNSAFGIGGKPKRTPETSNHEQKNDSHTPKPPPAPPLPDGLIDLYAVLNIDPKSSGKEIKKAAKERRIKTHPDRLERREGLTEEEKKIIRERAKQVGWAADILTDPEQREEYDREVRLSMARQSRRPVRYVYLLPFKS
ncbi:MAG: hypothetical protein Q9217_003027 [Psora testacea]